MGSMTVGDLADHISTILFLGDSGSLDGGYSEGTGATTMMRGLERQ